MATLTISTFTMSNKHDQQNPCNVLVCKFYVLHLYAYNYIDTSRQEN